MSWFHKSWRFKLEEDFNYTTPLLFGIEFKNRFITITNSTITINKGYAWDGCSPAYKLDFGSRFPYGLWFGTWDGPLRTDCRAVTHRAALVHDALCQFRNDIPGIGKQLSVDIFKEILVSDNAPLWMIRIYPLMVNHLGPQNWGVAQQST